MLIHPIFKDRGATMPKNRMNIEAMIPARQRGL
jgi:hypothetical protein